MEFCLIVLGFFQCSSCFKSQKHTEEAVLLNTESLYNWDSIFMMPHFHVSVDLLQVPLVMLIDHLM